MKLPENLRDHPMLQAYHGTVEWAIRGTFDFHMGWFSGKPDELNPLSTAERRKRLLETAGAQRVKDAIANETDGRWKYELAEMLASTGQTKDIREAQVGGLNYI